MSFTYLPTRLVVSCIFIACPFYIVLLCYICWTLLRYVVSDFALATVELSISNKYFLDTFMTRVTDFGLQTAVTLFEVNSVRQGFSNLLFLTNI